MSTAIILALLGLFSVFLWYIRRRRPGPVKVSAPVPAAPNTLNGLPAELILLISDFMSYVDLICLCLCSRWLHIVLERRLSRIPKPTKNQKLSILRRLDRGFLDTFICHRCVALHKFDEFRDYRLPGRFKWSIAHPCLRSWNLNPQHRLRLYEPQSVYANYDLYFLHLQLVMKQFYRGSGAGISVDSLFLIEVKPPSVDVTALFCREAQICGQPPSFHLRIQDIMLFHRGEIVLSKGPMHDLRICCHEGNRELMHMIRNLLKARPSKTRNRKDAKHRGICWTCNTVYQVELASIGEKRAVVITRWIDLGAGVDPRDPRWGVHLSRAFRRSKREYAQWLGPGDERSSPQYSFEKTCAKESSFEETRSRNLFYLQDGNYRKLMKMQHWIPPTWALKKRPARGYS